MKGSVGLTRDVGWNLGVRRTVDAPLGAVWEHLLGDGLTTWLGACVLSTEPGATYRTVDGTTGEVRSCAVERRLRLTWQLAGADHDTTLQVTLVPAARGTTIAFHQERMTSGAEREQMLSHWTDVVRRLVSELRPT